MRLADFVARIGRGLDETLGAMGAERGPETTGMGLWRSLPRAGRVLAVCHAGTTSAVVSHLLGLPQVPWAWERLSVGHATSTRLRTVPIADGAIFSLRSLGDDAHLEGVDGPSGEIIP